MKMRYQKNIINFKVPRNNPTIIGQFVLDDIRVMNDILNIESVNIILVEDWVSEELIGLKNTISSNEKVLDLLIINFIDYDVRDPACSSILEEMGFYDITLFVGYEYRRAYIFCGKEIGKRTVTEYEKRFDL